MGHFPVTHSNLSATHLALFLQEKYVLSKQADCFLIRSGINDTYSVNDGDKKFVFRIYSLNWRTRLEIEEEIRLLNELKDHNIPVSYAIADKDKNYVQQLHAPEGERFGVLFSYAAGEKVHSFSEDIHFNIGVIMAQLHRVTHNFTLQRITYTPNILLVDSLNDVRKFLSANTEEMAFMETAQTRLLQEFSKADASQVRNGAVHLDIWFENLNVTRDNKVTLFDFDFCGNGWLCLDMAFYILQVNSIERNENDCTLKVNSFLKGYESITNINAEEKRLIPMLGVSLYFFYLGVQCQRFNNWSNSFLSENYLKRFINALVKRYYDLNKLGEG